MANPHAIQIHCDGAMDYDKKNTGGNGFFIEFPDSFNIESISRSIRNDGQGIHRLEIISLIEAMNELLLFAKNNPKLVRQSSGIELYTDRMSVTNLVNPYLIRGWRKNNWLNYEGKAIKDKDLLDKLDKTRTKLSQVIGGQISISYVREKRNKVADKLSKTAKKIGIKGSTLANKKQRNVTKRIYDGKEVDYFKLTQCDIEARVYAWETVGKQVEVCFEICSDYLHGSIVKAYVIPSLKDKLHRSHIYKINISKICSHHIEIKLVKEVIKNIIVVNKSVDL